MVPHAFAHMHMQRTRTTCRVRGQKECWSGHPHTVGATRQGQGSARTSALMIWRQKGHSAGLK
jgi:hypothetical protein